MQTEERALMTLMRELKLPYNRSLNTKEKIFSVVKEHLLHNPEVSSLSKESLRLLQKYGWTLVYEDGRKVSV